MRGPDCLYVPMSFFHVGTARPMSTKFCTDLHTDSGKVLNTSKYGEKVSTACPNHTLVHPPHGKNINAMDDQNKKFVLSMV